MNRFVSFAALALGLIAFSGSAVFAEEGRYIMERIDDGVVRLDTKTGEMSLCRQQDAQMVCRMAADERHALEEEIALLEQRIAALERALDNGGGTIEGLPSEDEIDRTMGIMEDMMRRFLGVIEEFENRIGDGGDSGGPRNRT